MGDIYARCRPAVKGFTFPPVRTPYVSSRVCETRQAQTGINSATLYESVLAAGIPIMREPFDGPFGRTFSMADPDGYQITVYERDQPLFWPPAG